MTAPTPSKNYADYVVAEPGKPSTAYNATSTTATGFLEFKPRDMATQTKYDAMSPGWQGVASSTAAVARGDYSLDAAEATRRELREKVNVPFFDKPSSVQVSKQANSIWDSATQEFVKLKPAQSPPKDAKPIPSTDTKYCIIQ